MEAERFLEWRGVHLADVDAAIAGIRELADPGVGPGLVIAEHAVGMGVKAGEQAGARGRAGGGRDIHAVEERAFGHQAVEVGRDHVAEPGGGDSVEPLLVGDDHDDVGPGHASPRNTAGARLTASM